MYCGSYNCHKHCHYTCYIRLCDKYSSIYEKYQRKRETHQEHNDYDVRAEL